MSRNGKKIRLGLIGAGRIGRLHAENLATRIPQAELVTVADVVRSAAEETAHRFEIPTATDDPQAVLADSTVEAVLICSATDTHAALIEAAAAAGKHVFCEKPIDLDLGRIRKALEAVERAGVKLQVGFNRRFDANFARIRDHIAAGRIGEPHLLRITSRDPEPPPLAYLQVSGGIFLDMTIHDFDMARFLLNSEVEEVFAVGNVRVSDAFRQAGDVDTAVVTLKFENGALGTIDNSRHAAYGYDQRVEVFGSKGAVMANNRTPDDHVLLTADGVSSSKPLHFFLERYRDAFVAELQAFVDCIRNDSPPPVSGLDGLRPVQIGLAAKKSLAENRPVPVREI